MTENLASSITKFARLMANRYGKGHCGHIKFYAMQVVSKKKSKMLSKTLRVIGNIHVLVELRRVVGAVAVQQTMDGWDKPRASHDQGPSLVSVSHRQGW